MHVCLFIICRIHSLIFFYFFFINSVDLPFHERGKKKKKNLNGFCLQDDRLRTSSWPTLVIKIASAGANRRRITWRVTWREVLRGRDKRLCRPAWRAGKVVGNRRRQSGISGQSVTSKSFDS